MPSISARLSVAARVAYTLAMLYSTAARSYVNDGREMGASGEML
jgi:hypothetical protein